MLGVFVALPLPGFFAGHWFSAVPLPIYVGADNNEVMEQHVTKYFKIHGRTRGPWMEGRIGNCNKLDLPKSCPVRP